MPETWTINELAERVAEALAEVPVGQTSGRVRDVPDRRAIRWYTTIGLLDRPIPTAGRAAHYGRRHLLQIVAIKRRQAQGKSLAHIQAELVGASDEQLAAIALVPPGAPEEAAPSAMTAARPARSRGHFWREGPAVAASPAPAALPRVDTVHPAAHGLQLEYSAGGHQTAAGLADQVAGQAVDHQGRLLYGVPIAPGVTLLLDIARPPGDADVAALRAAAEPLVDQLRRRELTLVTTQPSANATAGPEPSQGRQP